MLLSRDFINYSDVLSGLVNEKNEINQDVLAFCFNLFDSETFIKALSILESNNLFIYVFKTFEKSEDDDFTSEKFNSSFYTKKDSLLQRIIIKEDVDDKIIFVDLCNWFCSCDDYNHEFQKNINDLNSLLEQKDTPTDLESSIGTLSSTQLYKPIKPVRKSFIEQKLKERSTQTNKTPKKEQVDVFAKIPLSGKYNSSGKITCAHLLASSVLLQSSRQVFDYYTGKVQTCYIIQVTNIDEWLRLQCNIVV